MINAKITDYDAVRALKVEDIERHLQRNGWEYAGKESLGTPVLASVWERYGLNGSAKIYVPPSRSIADYAHRVFEIIETLAILEKRSQIDVFLDLAGDLGSRQDPRR